MRETFLIFLLLYSTDIFAQDKKKKLSFGIFAGEPTGIFIEKGLNNKFQLEFNAGVNEIFYKYNYINKYTGFLRNQEYDRIFTTGINIKYLNSIKKFYWTVTIGTPVRIIYNYTYQNKPPGTSGIFYTDDPITKTKTDIGLNGFLGMGYPLLNNRFAIFMDFGGYFEIIDKLFWSNFQIRSGIKYFLYTSTPVKVTSK